MTPQFKGLFTPDAKTLEPNSMHIEYVLVTFTLCVHNSVWSDANSMLIQPNPPLEMIGAESEPNSLFIHWITINSHTVTTPWSAALSKLSHLGHHTCCIRYPRYQLQWPVMLGCSWIDAAENESAYQVISCSLSKFTFHVVYYQRQGKANNWTKFDVFRYI